MKPDMEQSPEHAQEREEQRKVARRYKRLGYDVQENPGPDLLPEFMRGVTPDLVARSPVDNVVIEIKRHRALKGSNDLVGIAERVSGRPDWRFELVVLKDAGSAEPVLSDADYRKVLDRVQVATSNHLFGMACVYLVHVLAQTLRDLARQNGVPAKGKADRSLVIDLGFKGVLPEDLVERCLAAINLRNDLAHLVDETSGPSSGDVQDLVLSCEMLRHLL